jgi:alpha-tubulin suppressor-like RCC1 family protein
MKKGIFLSIALSSILFANSIEAGYENYFVTDINGTAYSWGNNEYGDLGNNNCCDNNYLPTKLSTDVKFADISSLYEHILALSKDGKVYAWGRNNYGQLGDGTTSTKYSPELIDINDTIIQVSAGEYHSLALSKDGKVYAWG